MPAGDIMGIALPLCLTKDEAVSVLDAAKAVVKEVVGGR